MMSRIRVDANRMDTVAVAVYDARYLLEQFMDGYVTPGSTRWKHTGAIRDRLNDALIGLQEAGVPVPELPNEDDDPPEEKSGRAKKKRR